MKATRLQLIRQQQTESSAIEKVQSSKVSAGDVRAYLDSELMVPVSAIDAKIAMQSLVNQRAFLSGKLLILRAIVLKTEEVN
jgi:hypothetical protein